MDQSSEKNSNLYKKDEEKEINADNVDKENNSKEEGIKELSTNVNDKSTDDINEDSVLWNKKYLIENRKETVERQDANSKDDISNGGGSYNSVDNPWPSGNKGFRHSNQLLKKTISNANGNDYSMTYADSVHKNQSSDNKITFNSSKSETIGASSYEIHSSENKTSKEKVSAQELQPKVSAIDGNANSNDYSMTYTDSVHKNQSGENEIGINSNQNGASITIGDLVHEIRSSDNKTSKVEVSARELKENTEETHDNKSSQTVTSKSNILIKKSSKPINHDYSKEYQATEIGDWNYE